jgi:HD-GYP domain-containing protein (c-di-GMP phosphodiesterase class II)/CHASE2 domain-containing sensor protein
MVRGKDGLAILVAALAAVALSLVAKDVHLLDGVEDETVAMRFQARGAQTVDRVAVVAIDDVTFSDLEVQWPFKRSLHARAIDALRRAGAKEIVYDVQFTEPTAEREDLALFRAVRRADGVVLATTETDGHGGTNVLGGEESLAQAGAHAAAANLETDRGGVIHRFPYASGGLQSVAVVAAEHASGRSLAPSAFAGNGAWIDYAGPRGTVPTVSFSDLVSGKADPKLLRGRIVVVGATAPTLQDVHSTPTADDRLMSGPEIQANAIATALHRLPLHDAPAWTGLLALLLLGAAPALAQARTRGVKAAAVSPLAGLAFAGAAQLAFSDGWMVPVTYPLLALVLSTLSTTSAAFVSERRALTRVGERNDLLEERVRERTAQLRDTQLEVVRRLGQAVESRDGDTGEHIERISRLCHQLALAIGLPEEEAELIGHASTMHDVGKIGIPDSVLLKPSRLDAEEWALMQSHTTIGAAILAGSSAPLLQMAESIALTHHERWDGTGYPAGLHGDAIPLAARICAVCDVFDALLSTRRYKRPWSVEDALAELKAQRGRHFDPAVIDAFVAMTPRLEGSSPTDARDDPGVGVLTLDQSTPAGASERIHSRSASPPTRA